MKVENIGETPSLTDEEGARILDEMDRLLGEMQETMKTIRLLIGDSEPPTSAPGPDIGAVAHSS